MNNATIETPERPKELLECAGSESNVNEKKRDRDPSPALILISSDHKKSYENLSESSSSPISSEDLDTTGAAMMLDNAVEKNVNNVSENSC